MSNVDFRPYKRIVQYFWDPEPKNDEASKSPIWCLGTEYGGPTDNIGAKPPTPQIQPDVEFRSISNGHDSERSPKRTKHAISNGDHEEAMNSRGDATHQDHEWPSEFLDDFGSRMWFTYRSNFPAIMKSQDPSALTAMSLSVRLRSHLVDQGGFTSDTGWGCMIRSGQSLLANALVMIRLGRGMIYLR